MALIAGPLSTPKEVALKLFSLVAVRALTCLVVRTLNCSVLSALKSRDVMAAEVIAWICVELSVAIPAVVKLAIWEALKLPSSVAVRLAYWSADRLCNCVAVSERICALVNACICCELRFEIWVKLLKIGVVIAAMSEVSIAPIFSAERLFNCSRVRDLTCPVVNAATCPELK